MVWTRCVVPAGRTERRTGMEKGDKRLQCLTYRRKESNGKGMKTAVVEEMRKRGGLDREWKQKRRNERYKIK